MKGENRYSKMYFAVRDEVPDHMVPVLVAHAAINAHCRFMEDCFIADDDTYHSWFNDSFRKVVVRVNDREYKRIKESMTTFEGSENTVFNGEGSCLVVLPIDNDCVPNVLKFAKLWEPK